jgi:uncharacterized protein (TIGR02646 family)
MRKIHKGNEPNSLVSWKRINPTARYNELSRQERIDIRTACLQEQFYLCAYCCQRIIDTTCINEHVEAQSINPNRSLDFTNIVASCTKAGQCDKAHKSQPLPLTPFMDECEDELKFKISGRVEGLTDRAKETVRILNLGDVENNNRSLIEARKELTTTLLFNEHGLSPDLEDDELILSVIADIQTPTDGRLPAFSPVAVNILCGWLNS